MIIDCISDLHGFYPKLEGGDLLIVAGDLTAKDDFPGWIDFVCWVQRQKYKKVVVVGGNHDGWLIKNPPSENTFGDSISYLCDSGTEFEYDQECPHPASTDHVSIDILCHEKGKLKIWGSPWTLTFPGMNPERKAFTVDTEEELAEKFALIPDDVDILVTHGPPYGIMDEVEEETKWGRRKLNIGSASLCKALARIRPKLHIFGHIHEGRGYRVGLSNQWMENYCRNVLFLNCSHVDESYKPVNEPIRVTL
jgi:Icc-related predicted phosphoesterase